MQTWLKCAEIDYKSYTTLEEVLGNASVLSALISDRNAVDYMMRSTTWADDVCADQNAMSYIGLNNYCANTLLNDEDWCAAICDSEYFESVLNVKVPTMTSDTKPSGECIGENYYSSNYDYYLAFDGSDSSFSAGNASEHYWIGYDFITTVAIKKIFFTSLDLLSYRVQYSNDKSTWNNATSNITATGEDIIILPTFQNAKYWRLLPTETKGNCHFNSIQFYGRQDV